MTLEKHNKDLAVKANHIKHSKPLNANGISKIKTDYASKWEAVEKKTKEKEAKQDT